MDLLSNKRLFYFCFLFLEKEVVEAGEVMLLHATSKDNANILDEVIKETKKQGYTFKSLDEFER